MSFLRTRVFLLLVISVLFGISGCSKEGKVYHIGVLQWSEKVQPYLLAYEGVIDSLAEKGYLEGVNVRLSYRNAEQDKGLGT